MSAFLWQIPSSLAGSPIVRPPKDESTKSSEARKTFEAKLTQIRTSLLYSTNIILLNYTPEKIVASFATAITGEHRSKPQRYISHLPQYDAKLLDGTLSNKDSDENYPDAPLLRNKMLKAQICHKILTWGINSAYAQLTVSYEIGMTDEVVMIGVTHLLLAYDMLTLVSKAMAKMESIVGKGIFPPRVWKALADVGALKVSILALEANFNDAESKEEEGESADVVPNSAPEPANVSTEALLAVLDELTITEDGKIESEDGSCAFLPASLIKYL